MCAHDLEPLAGGVLAPHCERHDGRRNRFGAGKVRFAHPSGWVWGGWLETVVRHKDKWNQVRAVLT